jgi:hypothetical protein
MSRVPSSGWTDVYRWCHVEVPMTSGDRARQLEDAMSSEERAPDTGNDESEECWNCGVDLGEARPVADGVEYCRVCEAFKPRSDGDLEPTRESISWKITRCGQETTVATRRLATAVEKDHEVDPEEIDRLKRSLRGLKEALEEIDQIQGTT